jgi:hypothetical protein
LTQEPLLQHKAGLTLLSAYLLNLLVFGIIANTSLAFISAPFRDIAVTANNGTLGVEPLVCRTEGFSVAVKGQMAIVATAARAANTYPINHNHGYDVICSAVLIKLM